MLVTGSAAMPSWSLGLAFLRGQFWLFWLWGLLGGLITVVVSTTGYSLLSASVRRDNPSVIVGPQIVTTYTVAAFFAAITFNIIAPGPQGFTSESSWRTLMFVISSPAILFAIIWQIITPKQITGRHAVDHLEEAEGGLAETTHPWEPGQGRERPDQAAPRGRRPGRSPR
jgi:hypothetical protein